MKRLLPLTLLYFTSQFANGQACGIYRIEYVGNITATNKEIVKVYLPTTMLLHRGEKERSEGAFIETALTNGAFNIEIRSHLTTPYNNIEQLLSFYKKESKKFKMKVSFLEKNSLKETILGIDWDKIEVSIVKDGKSGTLFRFAFKDISI